MASELGCGWEMNMHGRGNRGGETLGLAEGERERLLQEDRPFPNTGFVHVALGSQEGVQEPHPLPLPLPALVTDWNLLICIRNGLVPLPRCLHPKPSAAPAPPTPNSEPKKHTQTLVLPAELPWQQACWHSEMGV